jgi:hypothetical protein
MLAVPALDPRRSCWTSPRRCSTSATAVTSTSSAAAVVGHEERAGRDGRARAAARRRLDPAGAVGGSAVAAAAALTLRSNRGRHPLGGDRGAGGVLAVLAAPVTSGVRLQR